MPPCAPLRTGKSLALIYLADYYLSAVGGDEIMRIAIMGAGGIGAYIGARLAAAGEDVAFIARGPHLAALRGSGLGVESPFGDLHLPKVIATDVPAEIGPVDLVL